MIEYLNNVINTENNFSLNATSNVCLTPLYGILSICGVQRDIFNYSTETGAFTEASREFKERCTAIEILTTAAFALIVIPSTLIGLTLKAFSLCNPELRVLYQRLWTRNIAPPPPQRVRIQPPLQRVSNGLFSKGNPQLFNCVFPFATVQDFVLIQSVSRGCFELMHTPTAIGKYPILFSLQPKEKCSLAEHVRTLFSSHLSQEAMLPLNSHLFQTDQLPLFTIPLVDKVDFTHQTTAQEEGYFADLTPGLGTIQNVHYKCILQKIHQWWSVNSERASKSPCIFRLSLNASINQVAYEKEIVLIKYTLFYLTTEQDLTKHECAHEYLALIYIKDRWHCFDSRSINFLSDRSPNAYEKLSQFPCRFLNSNGEPIQISRVNKGEDSLNCFHLRLLIQEKVLPLFREGSAHPKFISKQNKAYYNLPIIIGHRTLEEMESLFNIRSHHERENYHLEDCIVPRRLPGVSLFRKQESTT
jgi:hypothetical protein